MRLSSALVALPLLLSGCVLPVNVITGAIASETTFSGKGTLGAGAKPGANPLAGDGRLVGAGGNVIAAGGGNVIAAGGGNVIAAGGGNAIAPASAPNAAGVIAAGGGNVIAAGGGNLVVTSGNGVIAAGGMNLTGGGSGFDTSPNLPVSLPGSAGDLPNVGPVESLDAGAVVGKVVVPGAMVGRDVATVAVPHTYVGVYDMTGQQIVAPVATDDTGAFRLESVPAFRLLSLRTVFTYNGHAYYVSSLVRVEATDVSADLSPVSTVTEAEFFKKASGVAPEDTLIGSPYLQTFLAGLGAWNGEVSADALAADAPLATRAASYAALKMRHPDAFKNDVDAAFDHTATVDPTGLMAGEAPAGGLAAEL